MRGRGVLSGIKNFAKKANDYLRKTKAISRVSGALSGVVPYADQINKFSSQAGYGKRRRRRRRR